MITVCFLYWITGYILYSCYYDSLFWLEGEKQTKETVEQLSGGGLQHQGPSIQQASRLATDRRLCLPATPHSMSGRVE